MKKLVIIGGGFAGSLIAKKLENKFETILIDKKDYFEFTPSILKVIVNPKKIIGIQKHHNNYLKKTEIIVGEVSEVKNDRVIVNRKEISFDYLCICSGSSYSFPIKDNVIHTTRASHLIEHNKKLENSKKVLIIGGGLVGVELAAEIIDRYIDKEITIVHSRDKLIMRNHEKAIKIADNFLRKRGVKIIFNEKITKLEDGFYITNKNTKLEADIAFLCTGIKPNADFMIKNFNNLLDNSYLKVNQYIQLEDHNNIFAPGDVNNIKVEKTAQNAINQAKIVIKNILALENKSKLSKYKSKETPIVISLGKSNAIFTHKNINFSGIIPSLIKYAVEKSNMVKL
jgi:NADH dehydrogenase FAD-containing subunit